MCRRPVPVFLLASILAAACGGASSTAGQGAPGISSCNGTATQLWRANLTGGTSSGAFTSGNVTFTAATDALTARKWSAVGVDSACLKGLSWSDFEVVELGTRIDWGSGSCSRTPIAR